MRVGIQLKRAIRELAANAAWSLVERQDAQRDVEYNSQRVAILTNAIEYVLYINGMTRKKAEAYAQIAVAAATDAERAMRKLRQ